MSPRGRGVVLLTCVALAGCGGGAVKGDGGAAGRPSTDGAVGSADAPRGGDAEKLDVAQTPDAAAGSGGGGSGGGGTGAGGAGSDGPLPPSPDAPDASPDGMAWLHLLPVINQTLAPADGGPPFCYASGWCWSNPAPIGGPLAVWPGAADDVWVVGPHGATRHFDGKGWTNFAAPTTKDLRAVWGAAPDAVWAAGAEVVRWDGAKWVAGPAGAGESLAGRSRTEVWLGNPAGGLSHLDGDKWTVDDTRLIADLFVTAGGTLLSLTGYLKATEVLAKPPGGPLAPLTSMVATTRPTGVWGTGTNDVWIARTFELMRFDGKDLRTALVSPLSVTQPQFRRVRGSAANDVWVSLSDGSMVHWDGARFERWLTGLDDVEAIAARAANDAWVAGGRGSLQRFEGTGWRRHFSGRLTRSIQAMARVGADEVWAVGADAQAVALRYRPATGWQEVESPAAVRGLSEVWGAGPSDVWVTGVPSGANALTFLAHWDGAKWTRMSPDPADEGRTMVWGSATDDVWAGGTPLVHWDGKAWTRVVVDLFPGGGWWYVHGSAKDDVWLLGNDAAAQLRLVSWNGTSWTERTPGLADIVGVFVRGRDDVFVWSEKVIRHFAGGTWTTIRTLPDADDGARYRERSVSARAGELWAATAAGVVESWNGTTWTPSDALGVGFETLLAAEDAVFLGASSEAGGILRKPRP